MTKPLLIILVLLYGVWGFSQGQKNQILIVEVLQGPIPELDSSVTSLDSLSGVDSSIVLQDYMTPVVVLVTLKDTTALGAHFNLIFSKGNNTLSSIPISFQSNNLPPGHRTKGEEVYFKFDLGAMTLPHGQKRLEVQLMDHSSNILMSKFRYF